MNVKSLLASVALAAAATIAGWSLMGGATAQNSSSSTTTSTSAVAIFAGGCFWCVESDFDHVPGVIETLSGYTGGTVANPSYRQVSGKQTGHREAVQITYDPAQVSYRSLVDTFLRTVDAVDNGGQFCDRGFVYSPAIYALDQAQAQIANARIASVNASGILPQEITLPVEPASTFYAAEDYHQNYHQKNGLKYGFYRASCGRDRRVDQLWGDQARLGVQK